MSKLKTYDEWCDLGYMVRDYETPQDYDTNGEGLYSFDQLVDDWEQEWPLDWDEWHGQD